MRLIFTDPRRRSDLFVINDRTDGDPVVHEGETFTVTDTVGRALLAAHHPRIQTAQDPVARKPRPAAAANKKPRPADNTTAAKPAAAAPKKA